MTQQWYSLPAEHLLWESWESDSVVYDRTTGETHLLNALPAELLLILQRSPLTTTELAAELAHRCDTENNPEWRCKTEEMLASLASLGLVRSGRG